MKYFNALIFVLATLCCDATAAHFSLVKVDPSAYEAVIEKIKAAIGAGDANQETVAFDKSQSFLLRDNNQQRLGYLIPVKFNSKPYKNTICALYFVDLHNNLSFAALFAEKNEDDDVVSSCVGIDAVAIQDKAENEVFYLAILRYRTVNNYGSKAAVLTYNNGTLLYDKSTRGAT